MKTSSLWGAPPSRYYSLLRKVAANAGVEHPTMAVLGCADGKFVLPAARRGFKVWAIDIDEVTLFGGVKKDTSGEVPVPGLANRVKAEGFEDSVEIVHGDFMAVRPDRTFDCVFTSGALQYSNNLDHTLAEMVDAVGDCVKPGGLLYIDYMLPYEEKYQGRPTCPEAPWWQEYFKSRPRWDVKYNRAMPPTLDKAHLDYPVDHYHQWGHVLARLTPGS
ncbi:class I SAM-dependent methyltransferase [Kitasatospora acidiphila]|uniref:Class I SAM-dependent methyltransferase n=1 Tax=Kitasatospora acidiphila TaxID=2567942 RepID=A0A540WC98_9ACTN|nr:class I SAM-dependent methyltransferase [Kitasatospora acidiphila]TQF06665.1 class I SAM-dependent methyltransferase [Kitasatospora acidiphila]